METGWHETGGGVVRICRGQKGKWEVLENELPAVSFESRQDACDYANKLRAGRAGAFAIVVEEGLAGPAARTAG